MHFTDCVRRRPILLMEGALGERLKRTFRLPPDENIGLAGHVFHEEGRSALKSLWLEYAGIAALYGLPFLAATPTRRADRERVKRAGLAEAVIKENARFLRDVQKESKTEFYVGGMVGNKGDAYTGRGALPEREAGEYHKWQIDLLAAAGVDYLYAALLPTLPEAAGMAAAMAETGLPFLIGFTIQGDGRLIDGTAVSDAIAYIDHAVPRPPVGYMACCVHPRIVAGALSQPVNRTPLVRDRFLGIQGNTSPLPYAELDNAEDLKASDPVPFAEDMLALRERFHLKLFGGCCGTDGRHMEQVAKRLCGE